MKKLLCISLLIGITIALKAKDKDVIVAVAIAENYNSYKTNPYATYYAGYKESFNKTSYKEVAKSEKDKLVSANLFKDLSSKAFKVFSNCCSHLDRKPYSNFMCIVSVEFVEKGLKLKRYTAAFDFLKQQAKQNALYNSKVNNALIGKDIEMIIKIEEERQF
jgi:hypothetical protein